MRFEGSTMVSALTIERASTEIRATPFSIESVFDTRARAMVFVEVFHPRTVMTYNKRLQAAVRRAGTLLNWFTADS